MADGKQRPGHPRSLAGDDGPLSKDALNTLVVGAMRPVLRVAFHLKVSSPGNVPAAGPLVVVANHESLLDGFLVALVFPRRRLTFLSSSYLFEQPVVGPFLRFAGALPVQRHGGNLGSFREAIRILQRSGTVAIFPQGGVTSDEILGGAVYLALKAQAPLLPLHITGSRAALPPGRAWPSSAAIAVDVGRPLTFSDLTVEGASTKQAVAHGRQILEHLLAGSDSA